MDLLKNNDINRLVDLVIKRTTVDGQEYLSPLLPFIIEPIVLRSLINRSAIFRKPSDDGRDTPENLQSRNYNRHSRLFASSNISTHPQSSLPPPALPGSLRQSRKPCTHRMQGCRSQMRASL